MIWFVAKRRGSCYGDRVGRCTTALQTHCCWNARGSHNFTVELPSVSVAFEDFLYHPNGKLAGSLWVRSDYPEKCAPSALQGNSRPCPKTNPHSSPLPRRKGVENSDGAMCNRLSLACHFQSRPKWSANEERMRASGAGFPSQISKDKAAWCKSISNVLTRPPLVGRGSDNSSYAKSNTQSTSLKL